jgi:hypothetical protein
VEKMKNLDQVQQPIEKLLWLAHAAWLWTHVVDNKKQTLKGLKKIVNLTCNSGLCISGHK